MTKKIILIFIVIAIVLGVIIYQFFIKDEKTTFILEKVVRGTVVKEISETGTVRIREKTNLSFKYSGRIEEIYVEVGDEIEAGQGLAKLDTGELFIQLSEAQAALEVAQANYNKLLAGASAEEVKVAETAVLNAQVSLENAQQNLADVEVDAEEDLKNAYQDSLNVLDDSYLEIYDTYNMVNSIQRSYFTLNDQEGIKVRDNRNKIQNALNQTETYINEAKSDFQHDKIDTALSEVEELLEETNEALEVIRDMTETTNYRDAVSSADKTSLDSQKSYINTANTNIVNTQQTISTTKITNETNINSAEASISTAEAGLQKAQDELALKKAGPTQEDIALYQAKKRQAQAQVSLLENKIQEAVLKSPSRGQITNVNKRKGEMVQLTESVVSFLPSAPFQIKVDIYEEDVVDIKIGNSVDIDLVAFPDQTIQGRVISIDPAEKLIAEIVYYEVTIDFEETKEGIRQGMTADIVIESARKEDVLVVSKKAVKKMDGKKSVQVFKDGQVQEREIEIGLEGNGLIEVISGLEEGEEVIIGEKL